MVKKKKKGGTACNQKTDFGTVQLVGDESEIPFAQSHTNEGELFGY